MKAPVRNKSRLVVAGLFAAALMSLGVFLLVLMAVSTDPYPGKHIFLVIMSAVCGAVFMDAITLFIRAWKSANQTIPLAPAPPPPPRPPGSVAAQENPWGQKVPVDATARYVIRTIGACEYVEVSNGINERRVYSLTHKGDCKNPIHCHNNHPHRD